MVLHTATDHKKAGLTGCYLHIKDDPTNAATAFAALGATTQSALTTAMGVVTPSSLAACSVNGTSSGDCKCTGSSTNKCYPGLPDTTSTVSTTAGYYVCHDSVDGGAGCYSEVTKCSATNAANCHIIAAPSWQGTLATCQKVCAGLFAASGKATACVDCSAMTIDNCVKAVGACLEGTWS